MSELTDDPTVLRERVLSVRERLAAAGGRPVDAVPVRVAASVAQLGLTARLVSPAIALGLVTGLVPDLALARVRWQPVLGGAFPMSILEPAAHLEAPELDKLARELADQVLDGPVRELVEAILRFSVSPRILWGNVASAVNGATTMIAANRPGWAARARELTELLLVRPPLRGTGTWTEDGRFRRRSCCLIYQVGSSPAAVCGDCVLVRDQDRPG
jgi:hypothetical protein